jgi:hypothetical protein
MRGDAAIARPAQAGLLNASAAIRPEGTLQFAAGGSRKMADDRTMTGQADRIRINLNEDYEVRYWTEKWGVSREELAAAVHAAGPMVMDVAKKLGKES